MSFQAPIPPPSAAPSPKHPHGQRLAFLPPNYRRLIITLAIYAAISLLFYTVILTQTGLRQTLVAMAFIAGGMLVVPFVYFFLRRGNTTIAGALVLVGVALAYGGNELAWRNLTTYHAIGGILLIYLSGAMVLPRKRAFWVLTDIAYLFLLTFIDAYEPLPRFDAAFSPALQIYAIASNVVLGIIAVGQAALGLRARKLRTQFVLNLVLLIFIPVTTGSALNGILGAQESLSKGLQLLDSVASLKANRIVTWQESLQTNLKVALPQQGQEDQIWMVQSLIDEFPSTKTFYQEVYGKVSGRFQQTIDSTFLFSEIFIISPEGLVVLSTLPEEQGKNVAAQPYFAPGLQQVFTTSPYVDSATNAITVVAATPIIDSFGETIGVLAGRANILVLNGIMSTREGMGATGETYLVNQQKQLATPRLDNRTPLGSAIASDAVAFAIDNQWNGNAGYLIDEERPVIGAYRWIPSLDVALIAEQELSEALASTFQSLFISLGVTIAAVVLGIVAGVLITNQITIPLTRLAATAEAVAAGDLDRSVSVQREDELGQLASAFNAMTGQLRELVGNLEKRVTERTQELASRSLQLQVASEVARDAAGLREMDTLLARAVNLIRDRFGFYHAGIFLVDDRGEYAVLRSATGEAGQKMLDNGHRLKVGETGIVGYVTQVGLARIAHDVGADAVYFRNPMLPLTRSEVALPLKSSGKVIGALDVQSADEAAFNNETVQILQTLADQLAVAISNARLFSEMQQALHELETVQGRYTQETWATLRDRLGRASSLRLSGPKAETAPALRPEARQAVQQNRTVLTPVGDGVDGGSSAMAVAVPLRLRGQIIGVINLHFQGQAISAEMITIVEEIANRLALFFENARLLEEAQHLAMREQQINLLSTRIRSSANVETILQNTVRELGKVLGASRTFIQLGVPTKASADYEHKSTLETP